MESRPFSDHFRPGKTFFFTEIDFLDKAKMEPFEILERNTRYHFRKRDPHFKRCPHFQFLTAFFFFQTVDDFRDRLETKLRENYSGVAQGVMPEGYLEAPLAYDAIWAVALGNQRIIVIFVRMRLRSSYFLSFFLLCTYHFFPSWLLFCYTTITSVRTALNRTMEMLHKNGTSLEDYNYENIHIMDILRDQMADVDFMGMSVSIKYEMSTGRSA